MKVETVNFHLQSEERQDYMFYILHFLPCGFAVWSLTREQLLKSSLWRRENLFSWHFPIADEAMSTHIHQSYSEIMSETNKHTTKK